MCSGCEVAFVLPFAPFLYFVQSVAKSEQAAHSRELSDAEAEVHQCLPSSNLNTFPLRSSPISDQQNEGCHRQ